MTRLLVAVLLGTGCVTTAEVDSDDSDLPVRAEDCIPTLADTCVCARQCLTQEEIDGIEEQCDCAIDGEVVIDWTCTVEDDQCAVVGP